MDRRSARSARTASAPRARGRRARAASTAAPSAAAWGPPPAPGRAGRARAMRSGRASRATSTPLTQPEGGGDAGGRVRGQVDVLAGRAPDREAAIERGDRQGARLREVLRAALQ